MAFFDDSHESRTERPTERRRRQAREQGMVARSTELLTAARSLSIWIVLGWWFVSFADVASSWLRVTFQQAGEIPHSIAALSQLREQSWRFVATASWPLLIATAAILLAHFLQVGWLWRWNNLAPQASRLSPATGLQRLLSSANAGRAGAIVLKLIIVLGVSSVFVAQFLPITTASTATDLSPQFTGLATGALKLVSQVTFALLVYGVMDYGLQRWRFEQSLLMTREEAREELKEVEGDPCLKHQRHTVASQPSLSESANLYRESHASESS